MLEKGSTQKVKLSKDIEQPVKRATRLTLQNLIAEGTEIWVKNRTGKLTGKNSGLLVLQVGSGNMIDSVVIPPGNDPVCLTDQVTPKLLSECMDLFKLVKSGALELLDPASANKYYAKNQERKRLMEEKIQKLTRQTIPVNTPEGAKDKPRIVSSSNVEVNQRVGDICLKSKHAALSEQEALEQLFEQEEVLGMDDYNYILANGVYNGVKRWARDQVKKLMEAADAE